MKHIKKFNEDLDYLQSLEIQRKAREEFEKSKDEEVENLRGKSGHLDTLYKQSKQEKNIDIIIEERRILVQKVIDGILESERGKSDFKDNLIVLLNKYDL
jgi:hypothetical protein